MLLEAREGINRYLSLNPPLCSQQGKRNRNKEKRQMRQDD